MLRIDPPPDTLTLLQPGSLETEQLLPLREIARCLDQFDLSLARPVERSISVVKPASWEYRSRR
ncbi:hypothetical protein [Nocardia testacea]|uniref:hypothetical protein n=1 Tax=Nocardia testacea TaxID=248551 RepID=UPI0002FF8534|nr:hypothetical protein [Nocardia testacea]